VTRLHQIISRLPTFDDPDFEVLFDFDEVFKVAQGTDFSPAPMRSNMVWSHQFDGQLMAASSWDDRVLKLRLSALRGNAEVQAEPLQTLGRLLGDPRGQWFLWQDEGTVNPRYFRTRRCSFEVQDLLLLEDPKRTISMDIPAAPFAYGDEEKFALRVYNNPLAPSRPMSFVLDAVKGDVATPLTLLMEVTGQTNMTAIASQATPEPFGDPIWVDAMDLTTRADATWAWTTTAVDADRYIGGTARRLQHVGAITGADTKPVMTGSDLLDGIRPGNYRILARVDGHADPQWAIRVGLGDAGGGQASVGDGPTTEWTPVATTTVLENAPSLRWIDMGVMRFPAAYPLANDPLAAPVPDSPIDFYVWARSNASGGVYDKLEWDGFLLIPVGLDEAIDSRWAQFTQQIGYDAPSFLLDGAATPQRVIPIRFDNQVAMLRSSFIGSLPVLVPGASNMIHLIREIWPQDATRGTDDALDTYTDMHGSYRPRYVYGRSATG